VYLLHNDSVAFPPPQLADSDGFLAVGGDLSAERLTASYALGIFPWYNEPPILWFSPAPRFVLPPEKLRIQRSLKRVIAKSAFTITMDRDFSAVLRACQAAPRTGQDGSWLNDDLIAAFESMHALGRAHSVESWSDGELVGGLYGVTLGSVFFGESMFANIANASKVAFAHLVRHLTDCGFSLIDCQMHTPHLERFGAEFWSRERFQEHLAAHTGRKPATALGPAILAEVKVPINPGSEEP